MVRAISISDYFTDDHRKHVEHMIKLLESAKAFDVDSKLVKTGKSGDSLAYVVNTRTKETAEMLDHLSICDVFSTSSYDSVEDAIKTIEDAGYTKVEYSAM